MLVLPEHVEQQYGHSMLQKKTQSSSIFLSSLLRHVSQADQHVLFFCGSAARTQPVPEMRGSVVQPLAAGALIQSFVPESCAAQG